MPGSPHIERREIDKDAAVLSAQLTGFVEQIANEPNTGLGHVRKNVAKLQDTVLEPGKGPSHLGSVVLIQTCPSNSPRI